MKVMIKRFLFFNFLFWATFFSAQNQSTDSTEFVTFDCGITQTKQRLDKRFFASTTPIELRVNNEEFTFTTLQFGKRKNKMYLYLRILADNICIKKEKNVDVHFKSGEVITLKNEYPINCESFFAKQLKKKEIEKFLQNEITHIKIYTYKKNFEMYVSTVQNANIQHSLNCLLAYKIKKSDEVKVKKKKEAHQPTTNNKQPKEE
jgi:hypothetical protein